MSNSLVSPISKKSKSARKDANRKVKIADLSNYYVLYLEPSDIIYWQDGILCNPQGSHVSVGIDRDNDYVVDHRRTVIQYNSIKSSAITSWNAAGYSHFKKWGLSRLDRLAVLKGHVSVKTLTNGKKRILGVDSLTRTFWGKEWFPELIVFHDKIHQAYLVALVVFDPDKTLLGY